jgi:8-oxo-dGTP diphosphatase
MRGLVVGAAIIVGGRLLAAQRSAPPELAGGWELPGGKVEPGETDEEALTRECLEELGVEIIVGHQVGAEWPLHNGYVMHVWTATLAGGEPKALEHSDLRWLTEPELFDVPWLPADLRVVEAVRAHLRESR